MNLEWDRLRVFYYVAKEKSITRAAERLHTFQPTVTRNIQQLEYQAKSKLFIRNPKGLILTKQGEILFERVCNMMVEFELATNEISGTADEVAGELTLTTTYGYASTVLFKYISSFSKHHPNIRLRIVCDDTDPDLTKKEADVAVRPFIVNAQGLEQLYLGERKLQLFASKKYLEEAGVPEKTEDLDTHRLIIFELPHTSIENSQNNNFLLSLGRTFDSNRKPFMIVNSAECLAEAAEDGLGIIALSNDSSLIKRHHLTRVLPQIEDVAVKMCYIYPTALKNLRIVNLLGDYLKEAYTRE